MARTASTGRTGAPAIVAMWMCSTTPIAAGSAVVGSPTLSLVRALMGESPSQAGWRLSKTAARVPHPMRTSSTARTLWACAPTVSSPAQTKAHEDRSVAQPLGEDVRALAASEVDAAPRFDTAVVGVLDLDHLRHGVGELD